MKRLIPVFAAVLLICGLVFVKNNLEKAAPPDHDEDEAPASQTTPAPPPAAPGELPPEETVGPAGAKYKLTVGWHYDETNQANPQPLQDALQTLKRLAGQNAGTVSLQIVDIDVPLEDRSPEARAVQESGLAVNGVARPELADNPGEGNFTGANAGRFLDSLVRGK